MTSRANNTENVPDLLLERYRLGEMSPTETEEMRRLLATDEALRARLQALDESDEEIRRRYPSGWLAERIQEKLRTDIERPMPSRGLTRFGWRLPFAVAAAGLVIALGWRLFVPLYLEPGRQVQDSIESGDRLKGDLLVIFRKTSEGSELLANGSRVRAGDQIRIGYRPEEGSYGLILSIDGRGSVMRHFPREGEVAAPLTGEGLTLLDYAYELDDAPGWECFYLVSGPEAFDIEPVLEMARRLEAPSEADPPSSLPLSAPFTQSSFELRKEDSR